MPSAQTIATSLSAPCIRSRGPSPSKLLILGEAPGAEEARVGLPFVGSSGKELDRLLQEASIPPSYMTNVLWTRPPENKLEAFMVTARELKSILPSGSIPEVLSKPIRTGKFLHPAFIPELSRLADEIASVQPNLILALGNTALWATTGQTAISKFRGTIIQGLHGVKVLPTYHPAAVLRDWSLRPVVLADLLKAGRQLHFPEIRKPRRYIWTSPSLLDLYLWERLELRSAKSLAVDVETRNGQITEIGFAPRANHALTVPFILGYNGHYWPTPSDEHRALEFVARVLSHPCPKIFQNGLYDIQYIWKTWGIPIRNCVDDTMLRAHSLWPEMQKGLGFLGSIFTDEPAWKILRSRGDHEKRDDE